MQKNYEINVSKKLIAQSCDSLFLNMKKLPFVQPLNPIGSAQRLKIVGVDLSIKSTGLC